MRDEKTTSRTLAQLKDKLEQLTQKRDKLSEEETTYTQKKSEVSVCAWLPCGVPDALPQLDAKVTELSDDLKRAKQEHDNQQSERIRIE